MSDSEKKFWLKNGDLYYLTRMSSDYDYWILSKPGYGSLGNSKNIKDLIIQAEVRSGSDFDCWG